MAPNARGQPPKPNGALAEMLAADGVLDELLEGRGLDFSGNAPNPTVPAPQGLLIEPADWAAEEAERKAREAEHDRERVLREIEKLDLEEAPSRYPPPQRGEP